MLTSHRVFLGIDPGLSGAFVVYDAQANSVINARIIPTLVLQRNRKQKRTLDIPTLVLMAREIAHQHHDMVAYLELVNAAPIHGRRQGGSSMFNFGATNGAIKAAIVAAGIPYDLVPPAVWKKALACSQDKDEALARASELMPSSTDFWTPKRGKITKEDCKGVAEAAMIAWWGARYGKLSVPAAIAA